MFEALMIFYAAMSALAFLLYGVDKRRAKRGKWRTKESVLLGISFLGGSVGAMLGMKVFRHKTRHTYFWVVGFLGLVWQAALAILLFRKGI
jgi:uncharacterized membrane protein YsdA (DUF1294 family)